MPPPRASGTSLVPPITTSEGPASSSPPLSPLATDRRASLPAERLIPIPLSSLGLKALDDSRPLPSVHINKANLVELKNACDDAVKSIMKEHQFTEIHTHTDIKLALGWIAVLVAAGTAGYSYKYGFEQTRGIAMAGVVAYFVLSGIQLLYAYYFEGSKIYTGKRKSLSKRIETELIRISSRTIPHPSSASSTLPPASHPRYLLNVSYRRSANANKSLLRRARLLVDASYGELVDVKGGVEYERIRDWLAEVLGRVGGAGEESTMGAGTDGAISPAGKERM
ncbi:hypothetical protein NliqN6_3286 [Naganishia liquefaciens]|uniref:Signal peptidase complex subunit 2 n=1 Tax=Naganishia liquefaciens TaxID=104408 RepID=A0A8H3TVF1_9TREE|nr:hypothetical protein NliqN6_3286 [Naganishia liquefaciens]